MTDSNSNLRRSLAATAVLALTLPAAPAVAVPVVFTSLAAWTAAVTGIQTENFAASPLGALAAGSNDIGLFDVFITAADPNSEIASPGFVNSTRGLNLFLVGAASNIARFDFDSAITAWGGDFASTHTGDHLTVTVNGSTIQFDSVLDVSGPGDGFLGVVDTTPFSSITFDREGHTTVGEFFGVDNFRIAGAAAPEPATLALLGLAIAGLSVGRRRAITSGA